MSKKILVVGSINLDLVARVTKLPAEGETLSGESFSMYPGGKGANQAVGAARLGGDVVMIGRLGNDQFGDTLRRGLQDAHVSTRCVEKVEGASGVALITVTAGGGNSIVVIPGANAQLLPVDLDRYLNEFRDASLVLAQLEVPIETAVHLGQIARRFNVPFVLDPAPAQPLPAEFLHTVTWLTPNESETQNLLQQLGHMSPEKIETEAEASRAAEAILLSGVRNVALKLGSKGVYLAGLDVRPVLVPGFSVEAVDTTAAGDAFNAGLAYALNAGFKPLEAAHFASAVAAISVTRHGAQPSMPSLREVTVFLQQRGFAEHGTEPRPIWTIGLRP